MEISESRSVPSPFFFSGNSGWQAGCIWPGLPSEPGQAPQAVAVAAAARLQRGGILQEMAAALSKENVLFLSCIECGANFFKWSKITGLVVRVVFFSL